MNRLALRTSLGIFTILWHGVAAAISDVPANSALTRVVVYTDGAEVERRVELPTSSGAFSIVIDGLPVDLIPGSLRIEPASNADSPRVTGLGIEIAQRESGSTTESTHLSADTDKKLLTIVDAQTENQLQRDSLKRQLAHLSSVGDLSGKATDADARRGTLDPAVLESTTRFIFSQHDRIASALVALEQTRRLLDAQLNKLERAIERQHGVAKRGLRIRIRGHSADANWADTSWADTNSADTNGANANGANTNTATITGTGVSDDAASRIPGGASRKTSRTALYVRYRVPGPKWHPQYQLQVGASNKQGKLVVGAQIRQTTGEPWNDVHLALYSTSMSESISRLRLKPLRVNLERSDRSQKSAQSRKGKRPDAAVQDQLRDINEPFDPTAPPFVQSVDQRMTVLKSSGPVSVSSSEQLQNLALLTLTTPVETTLLATPLVSDAVHTEVQFTNTSEQFLPAGELAVVRANYAPARSHLEVLAPGANAIAPVGAEPRLRVTRTLLGRAVKDNGAMREITLRYRLALHNYSRESLPVTVLTRHPVGIVAEEVRLSLPKALDANHSPDSVQHDLRLGQTKWSLAVPPGAMDQAKQFDYTYALTFDRNFRLVQGRTDNVGK
jgi:hypothetical protein